MPDDELDELYAVKPDGFTAARSKLAAAAKKRGDASAAKRISATRKPTTAAWVVNQLAQQDKQARQRLTALGDRLRAAHASLDGEQIRNLSTEQHHLIDELSRAAFAKADLKNPSASLREDVTATLQAAIADSEVADSLGRLTKAERWSGFGGFGEAAPESAGKAGGPASGDLEKLQEAWTAAEQAKADADRELSRREEELTATRARHDEIRKQLRQTEKDLSAAENAYQRAKRSSRAAAEAAKEAKQRLKRRR